MVIQPRASATRHDVVDVVAPQVNDVGGRICAQSAIDPVEHQLAGLVVSDTLNWGTPLAWAHARAGDWGPPGCGECPNAGKRVHLRTWAACYVDRMDRFLVPAAASIVVGLLLGAAAIFGVTLMVQQDTKPPLQAGDPASSVLNRVEYGDRT